MPIVTFQPSGELSGQVGEPSKPRPNLIKIQKWSPSAC
jgi:hypothetical protein